MTYSDYIEYDFTHIQTDCLEDYGDVKAIAYIDACPMLDCGVQAAEGYVIAKIVLSKHNDVIVIWNEAEGRFDPNVLSLIEKAKIEIQEYR